MKKILYGSIIFIGLLFLNFSCKNSLHYSKLTEEKQSELIKQGNLIVQQSFQILSTKLSVALSEGGVQYAVPYCQLKTSSLIDSLSSVYKVKISRTSAKYRNPDNRPDALDLTVLDAYNRQLEKDVVLQPHIELAGGQNVIFYSPIVIKNPLCLLCHGEPGKTLSSENYDFIKAKYPGDLATGYHLGDLRGVWKVEFTSQ